MADEKKTGAAKTPVAPVAAPAVPKAPEAPKAPEGEKKPKAERVKYEEVFATAEAAEKEAKGREKGPRRAFKCTSADGKEYFVVANNEGRAGGIAFEKTGGKVEELGASKAGKTKAIGVDGVLAALNSLPEDQREAVLAQLAGLKK